MSENLPEGWADAMLGDVISGFETGRNLRACGRPATGAESGVLKISAVTWGSFRPDENKALLPGDEPRPHERVRAGDLLISRANTSDLVGAVVLVDRNYPHLMLPDKILRLKAIDSVIDRRFLMYGLRTTEVRSYFERNATGTSDSMRNLSQPKLAHAPIAIAPLAEQRRIVAKIEALIAQVNAARERLAKVPLILKRFRQAVLAAACSGRLTEDWREENTPTDTDGMVLPIEGSSDAEPIDALMGTPPSWRWATLDSLRDATRPIIYGIIKPGPHTPDGVPYVRVLDMKNGTIDVSDLRRASAARAALFRRATLRAGDILISKDGTIGRVAVVPPALEGGNITQHLVRFSPHPSLSRRYLVLALQCPVVQAWLTDEKKGVALQGVNVEDFRRLPLPIPPTNEQAEIADRVEALLGVADTIEQRVQAAAARATTLPQAILSNAFSGELVPTEAELARAEGRTYEPASVLIERIRAAEAPAEIAAKRKRSARSPARPDPTLRRPRARRASVRPA